MHANDFLHNTSTRLVQANDLIVVENLNVSGMVRNRRLGGRDLRLRLVVSSDTCSSTRPPNGIRQLVVIDRWFPSSKMCSASADIMLAELSLRHPDVALPVLRHLARPGPERREEHLGRRTFGDRPAELMSACKGDPFQQSAVKQEPQPVRTGIPLH